MVRSAAIGIRVEPYLKELLQDLAEKDRRTLAAYIEKVLVDHLIELEKLDKSGRPIAED